MSDTDWVDLAIKRRGDKPTTVVYLTKAEIARLRESLDPVARYLVKGPMRLMGMVIIEVPDEMVQP